MIIWVIFTSLLLSYTSFGTDYFKKEFFVCYDYFGCINFTKEWFDSHIRPRNYKPLARHIINTRFLLLTANEDTNIICYDSISTKIAEINITSYEKNKDLMVLIHDFTSNGYTGWIKHMSLLIDPFEQYNLLSVDWQEGAEPPYVQAISNARVVALEINNLLDVLQNEYDLMLHQIHLIGHGVGAHIAGYVGKQTCGRIGRITGLDPSGPLFEKMPSAVRLDYKDALYVEVIHTDGKGHNHQGTLQPMGHVDFYFNNGYSQPGCHTVGKSYNVLHVSRKQLKQGTILPDCNHKRSFKYYLESIGENKACSFLGLPHNTSEEKSLDCGSLKNETVRCATIGIGVDTVHLSKLTNAKFDIVTKPENPYCLNRYQMQITFAKCPEAEEESTGYFKLLVTDINGMRYNLTFDKILGKSKVLLANEKTTFVSLSTDPEIEVVKRLKLTWHFTTPFCYWCRNATCIEFMTLVHVRAFVDNVGEPVVNQFCPRYGQRYAVFYDQVQCNALVPCNKKL